MRKFEFVNAAAKREFLDLPKPIQRQFGADLQAVQAGLAPFSRWKHLTETVGIGAVELIENGSTAYRTVYCAKFGETVFILHSFTKNHQWYRPQGHGACAGTLSSHAEAADV